VQPLDPPCDLDYGLIRLFILKQLDKPASFIEYEGQLWHVVKNNDYHPYLWIARDADLFLEHSDGQIIRSFPWTHHIAQHEEPISH